jgi:tetraacyldisaccharide 4'-kinase
LAFELGARVVIVDDGFQHQRLGRDLDILVHSGDPTPAPFPLGWGREHRSSVQSAGLLWWHQGDGSPNPRREAAADVVSRYAPCALLAADGRPVGDPSELRGVRVCVVAGVAAPDRFRKLLERLGARVVGEVHARDHGNLAHRHFRKAAATRPELLICTEKDLVRMHGHPELTALACRVEILRGERRLAQATDLLTGPEGSRLR